MDVQLSSGLLPPQPPGEAQGLPADAGLPVAPALPPQPALPGQLPQGACRPARSKKVCMWTHVSTVVSY